MAGSTPICGLGAPTFSAGATAQATSPEASSATRVRDIIDMLRAYNIADHEQVVPFSLEVPV